MEDNKKSGKGRDLGDLKARLGLKKTGTMPAVTPPADGDATGQTSAPANSQTGAPSILPPPIAGVGPQPQPQAQPEPADPRRDPFTAQQQAQAAQLAAFYGLGQALPGSAEGVGDQGFNKPKTLSKAAPFLAVSGIAIVIGLAFGRLTAGRAEYNITIDHAAKIRDEVAKMAKNLDEVTQVLNASKDTLKGGIDVELTSKLAALDLKKPDTNKIFKTNYAHLDDIVIDRLMNYYNDTNLLYSELEVHIKKSEADKDAIASFVKNGAGKSDKNFGVVMDVSGAIPIAQMVEVGSPVCNKQGVTDCPPAELKGFKYRTDAGGAWGEKPLRGKPGETLTPLNQTPFFKSIASGSTDVLAAKDYTRRVASIQARIIKLNAAQKDVMADLKKAADKPKLVAAF